MRAARLVLDLDAFKRPAEDVDDAAVAVLAGLERDGLLSKKGIPKSFSVLCLMAEWSETQIPSRIFKALSPVFRWGARRAEARGLAAELIERYDGEQPS